MQLIGKLTESGTAVYKVITGQAYGESDWL